MIIETGLGTGTGFSHTGHLRTGTDLFMYKRPVTRRICPVNPQLRCYVSGLSYLPIIQLSLVYANFPRRCSHCPRYPWRSQQ